MAQIQNSMVNAYYDMPQYEDEQPQQFQQQQPNNDNQEVDEFVEMNTKNSLNTDTLAFEARNGKDIQAIPWERMNNTRDQYRELRLKQYKNYRNLPLLRSELDKEYKPVDKGCTFYDFHFNTRLAKSTIIHFQLRNLLCATSKHDVYLIHNFSAMHWSSLLRRSKEVLNVSGTTEPTMKRAGSLAQPVSRVQMSTMAVKNNLMVAGGFRGELVCKHLNRPGVSFCTKITTDDNSITNAVDIYENSTGSTRLMTANNDAKVRIFDAENFALLNDFCFPWSVNNTSASPDGKLFAVLGDSSNCFIADAQSGKVVETLRGHSDYSFSSAWHPDGRILATGNQDKTCRLWDVRNTSGPVDVLQGRIGAIRSIKFTSDGRFMAMAEPADFVHIYDTQSGYSKEQEIDLFGEISGMCFSPDSEAFFVGVADRMYGSLMEFNRRRCNYYLDNVI